MAGLSEGVVEKYVAVVKGDDTVVALRGFHVGVAGDVVIKDPLGAGPYTIKNCVAGMYYPYACSRIMAATTATDIVGLV